MRALYEMALCALAVVSTLLFLAAPVIVFVVVDGLRRLAYSWP